MRLTIFTVMLGGQKLYVVYLPIGGERVETLYLSLAEAIRAVELTGCAYTVVGSEVDED